MQVYGPCKVPVFAGAKPKLFPLKREVSKILLVMRITAILLLVTTLQVSAKGWGQEKINLSVNDAPLEQVLNSIKVQTTVSIVYRPEYIKGKKVTMSISNASLKTALDLCLDKQNLKYEIVGKNVVIYEEKKEKKPTGEVQNSGSLNDLPLAPADITGRVTNEQGEPLSGANVVIKRTSTGTVTNANGEFTLKKVNVGDVITVSYIGYSTFNFKANNESNILIIMHVAANKLDEAVIQAYGKTTDRFRTGNISRVTSEDLEKHPVMNAIEALQGQVPGAVITNANGAASSSIKIEIRGRNTINPAMVSEPLYIIDGVPLTILNLAGNVAQTYVSGSILSQGTIQSGIPSEAGAGQSPFLGINPSDIESIEVLKDADATAIYGSRGSNGVILITTKKGKAGKTHAEINVFTGYSQVPRYYSLLNTDQYIAMRKEALKNDNLPVNAQTALDLVSWDTTKYTDWQKYLWGGTGRRTSLQMNLSGGDARTSFRAAGGYDYDKDIVTDKGGNKRGSFSLNLNHKSINQKLGFTWSSIYSTSTIDLTNRPGSVLLPPDAPPIYDNNGKLNFAGWGTRTRFPFNSLLESYVSKTNLLNSNIGISYEIFKGLTVSGNLGYNYSQNSQTKKIPIASQNPASNPKGTLRLGNTYFQNIVIEPKIEYSTFVRKGKLTILFGGTSQTNKTDGTLLNGVNYTNDLLLTSINNAPNKNITDFNGEYKYTGVFGRLNYNWANKYIVNLNARRDGSSRFGPGRQFGNFGSVGAAWIFTEENWMKHFSFLSFGKFRSSYGITGSDQIGDYAFLSLWQIGGPYGSTGTYNSLVPINPLGFSDSLLQWEVNKKLEAAISLGFLKDRILVEASWYRNRCGNQLVSFPTPAFSGFSGVTSNTPANVQNMGWEFVLTTKNLELKNFNWSTRLLLTINRNKLLSYPNLDQSPFKNRFVIGKSLNIQKYLHFTGVDPQTGKYTFDDVNKDGNIVLGEDDTHVIDLTPKYDGGVTNNFRYKNFELSVFFYFRKQLGTNILVTSGVAGNMSNQPTEVLSRWQKPGDVTSFGKFSTQTNSNTNYFFTYSDARISDASFIRLQNVSLGYYMPEKIRKKAGLGNFKIFVQGENLLVITKYKGIDPEIQTLGNMPRPRLVTTGLSCTF